MAIGQGGGCLIQDRAADNSYRTGLMFHVEHYADNGYRTGRRLAAAHRAAVGGGSQGGGCLIQDRAVVGGGSQGGGWLLTGRRFIIVFKVSPRQPPDRKKTGEKCFTWNILHCFLLNYLQIVS